MFGTRDSIGQLLLTGHDSAGQTHLIPITGWAFTNRDSIDIMF